MTEKANIIINMDATCKKCGEKGAAQNGYCLRCIMKYILPQIVRKRTGT